MSDKPYVASSVVPPPPLSSASPSCNPRADADDVARPTHTAFPNENELQIPFFADDQGVPLAVSLNGRDNSTDFQGIVSNNVSSSHSECLPDAELYGGALVINEDVLESLVSVTNDSLSSTTDDTLHNKSSESDISEDERLLDNLANMGNQQTARKTVQSDDDTPDELKTKCCEIPKKKVKDRNSRVSRTSRTDDLVFDTAEVYPFEGRTRSEQELSDPVELEPFDIVETDDIRFVPGAGTSAVIQSASEPRFQTIPEDTAVGGEHEQGTEDGTHQTDVKTFYIEKGSKLIEPGTSTAHSTFEFKQVKTKANSKPNSVTQSALYENTCDVANPDPPSGNQDEQPVSPGAAALPTSPTSSENSSRQISRNNSKNDIQKPARKGKPVKIDGSIMTTSVKEINEDAQGKEVPVKETKATSENKRQRTKSDKKPAIRDSEIDRNIDNVLLLTQTMFSGPRTSTGADDNELLNSDTNQQEGVQAKYENVNRCVKLESKGLAIVHKDEAGAQKRVNKGENTDRENVDRVKEAIQITRQGTETEQELLKYENVGVCVKLEPTGLSIQNKELPAIPKPELPNRNDIKRTRRKPSDDKEIVEIRQEEHTAPDKDMNKKKRERKSSSDKEFVEITRNRQPSGGKEIVTIKPTDSEYIAMGTGTGYPRSAVDVSESAQPDIRNKGILHISDSGTLIIKSLPMPPTHAPSSEPGENHYYENDIIDRERTDIKVPYVEAEGSEADCSNLAPDKEKQLLKVKEGEKEIVPPPSPSTMDVLAEEEEEEEEEFEDDYDEERRRKSLEMFEFTEDVCKRLSQLLEKPDSSHEDENEDYLFESGKDFTEPPAPPSKFQDEKPAENIYETIDEDPKWSLDDASKQVLRKSLDMSADVCLQPPKRSESSTNTLKRTSGDSEKYKESIAAHSDESDDGLPDYFQPEDAKTNKRLGEKSKIEGISQDCESVDDSVFAQSFDDQYIEDASISTIESFRTEEPPRKAKESHYGPLHSALTLPIRAVESGIVLNESTSTDIHDKTPTEESQLKLAALTELVTAKEEELPVQFDTSSRQSYTCTESDLDISEHRDDMSTDSMLADDEAEETMEILFTKTYTEPVEGAEVFLSCTVVNSKYRNEERKSETWPSDDALEYFEANATDLMSTAFLKAKKEMKDIQMCIQGLRRQMERNFHSDAEDTPLPGYGGLVPDDYFRVAGRKAVTD